jgi:hypothetical protein
MEKRTNHQPSPDEAIELAYHFHQSSALPGAERGVGYALAAANQAAARFAATEELQAVSMALELVATADERSDSLHERGARVAILASQWPLAIEHARVAVDRTADTAGSAGACELAVELGRLAERVEANAGWPFGHLVDQDRSTLDPGGEMAVQLLAWDVAEGEYLDKDNPGIPVDSPRRQKMNDLASRLPARQRPAGPAGYCYPAAAAMLDDYQQGQTRLAWFLGFGGPGRYRESADILRASIDRLCAIGYVSLALWGLGQLGRLRLVLGELDRVAEIQSEGEQLLERTEPESNAVGQFEALSAFRSQHVDVNFARALDFVERFLVVSQRADLRWARGSIRMWRSSLRAALGEHRQALDELTSNLAVVEQGCLGAPNYPRLIHTATTTLWWTGRTDHIEILERNLHSKVLVPDFSYAESDGRWTGALLAALTGRYDEARYWFQQSYDRLTAQEAILLIPHVSCDEALMEIRRGRSRDRANGRRRLDEARRWVDQIGLPNLVPRIDDLQDQLEE